MSEEHARTEGPGDGREVGRGPLGGLGGFVRARIRAGRLRFDHLDGLDRWVGRMGTVALLALLVAIVAQSLFSGGEQIYGGELRILKEQIYVPAAAAAAVAGAMGTGWVLILWGATRATWPVALGAAAGFLLLLAPLGRPEPAADLLFGDLAHESALPIPRSVGELAPMVVSVGYYAAPLVALGGRALRVRRGGLLPQGLLLLGLVASVGAVFGGWLWIFDGFVGAGTFPIYGLNMGATLGISDFVLSPVVLASVLALVLLMFRIASAAGTAVLATRGSRSLIPLIFALIGAKCALYLASNGERWSDLVAAAPAGLLAPASLVVLVAVVVIAIRRAQPAALDDNAIEPWLYGIGFLLMAPHLLGALERSFTTVVDVHAGRFVLGWDYLPLRFEPALNIAAAVALVAGLTLLLAPALRSRLWFRGSLLTLAGGWYLTAAFHDSWVRYAAEDVESVKALLDLALTVGIGALLVARRGRLTATATTSIVTLLVFGGLFASQLDLLQRTVTAAGLPLATVTVLGVLYSLAAESGFLAHDRRHMPAEARPHLWVGYLIVSLSVLLWFPPDLTLVGQLGREYAWISIGFAAFLVILHAVTPRVLSPEGR